jgi:hypothetical protein
MAILTCLAAKPARDAASEPFHGGPLSGAERQLKHEIARFRFCPIPDIGRPNPGYLRTVGNGRSGQVAEVNISPIWDWRNVYARSC